MDEDQVKDDDDEEDEENDPRSMFKNDGVVTKLEPDTAPKKSLAD